MKKEEAVPTPAFSPALSSQEYFLPPFHNLCIDDKSFTVSDINPSDDQHFMQTSSSKTKGIEKGINHRKHSGRDKSSRPKESSKKKIQKLQKLIHELETENDRLRRKIECCLSCSRSMTDENQLLATLRPNYEEEIGKIAGPDSPRHSRGSHGSLEFQNIEFHAPCISKQNDDRSWVLLGTVMIAMGSKCLDVDGTINVFKVLKETVDSLRRQVEKSEPNISMDFYISKEEMHLNPYMQEIGFDPFSHKHEEQGLNLQGVKVSSVEQFELTYDNKLTFNLKYEALIGAMEYIREHSWIIG